MMFLPINIYSTLKYNKLNNAWIRLHYLDYRQSFDKSVLTSLKLYMSKMYTALLSTNTVNTKKGTFSYLNV